MNQHQIQSQNAQQSNNKIILCMIVRNESKIITRCLDTVLAITDSKGRKLVDAISITDTGSDDNTVKILNDYLVTNQLKGRIWNDRWQDFGYNRSRSYQFCKHIQETENWNPSNTYALFIDADMNFIAEPNFDKESLTHDGYRLNQKTHCLVYANLRLARMDGNWICRGVTHEYWDGIFTNNGIQRNLDLGFITDLWIDDKNDGGCKSDKYERDERLLRKGLIDEPSNIRYWFYLAQTLRYMGKSIQAIYWYQKRIEGGSWDEEIWNSMLSICETYLDLYKKKSSEQPKQPIQTPQLKLSKAKLAKKQMKERMHPERIELVDLETAETYESLADYWAIKAFIYRPTRIESLHVMANHYRVKGQSKKANTFIQLGFGVPFPSTDMLFIRQNVFDYEMYEEAAICGYYGNELHKDLGRKASNRLMLYSVVPDHIKSLAYKNYNYYSKAIDEVFRNVTKTNIGSIINHKKFKWWPQTDKEVRYFMTNPSIQNYQNGYRIALRLVNYTQRNLVYTMYDQDQKVRTRYLLVELDSEFNLIRARNIIWKRQIPNTRIEGIEDIRFVDSTGEIFPDRIIGTCLEFEPNLPQIGSFILDTNSEFDCDSESENDLNETQENKLLQICENKMVETSESNVDKLQENKLNETSESNVNKTQETKSNETSESNVDKLQENKLNETSESNVNKTQETKSSETSESNVDKTQETKSSETSENKSSEVEEIVEVKSATWLIGPQGGRCEKNWMPLIEDGQVKYLYSMDQLRVIEMSDDLILRNRVYSTVVNKVNDHPYKANFREMRGGPGLIEIDGGYFGIVHEVAFINGRQYYHRFIWIRKDYKEVRVSELFHFLHIGIEFCCGMCIRDRKVVITIGNEDREAHLFTLNYDSIYQMMEVI